MKILSIDGGGIRGIISARILQEIETKTDKSISELFDIITGTSTGALLALALVIRKKAFYLATPDFDINVLNYLPSKIPQFSAEELVEFYLERSKDIFPKPTFIRKLKTGFGLWGSKYDRTAYDHVLNDVFGGSALSETLKPVFIPIYSLENDKPFICSTGFALKNINNDFYLKDIAGAATAAPTYFDPKIFKSIRGYIPTYQGVDGGIYANNPELIGVTGAYMMQPNLELEDITLLSLGTGEVGKYTESNKRSNNGDIGWLINKDIIGDMMDAESSIAETAIIAMLKKGSHFRIQQEIPNELAEMDNCSDSNLKALLKIAEDYIVQNTVRIDEICNKLTK